MALYCSACLQHQAFPDERNVWNCNPALASVLTVCIVFCTVKRHQVSGIARDISGYMDVTHF